MVCTEDIKVTTFPTASRDGKKLIREALVCTCDDKMFCSSLSARVELRHMQWLFRSMHSKAQAFEAAGSETSTYWAIPFFECLILNIDVRFIQRDTWEGEPALFASLDYSTPKTNGLQELLIVNELSSESYRKLVSDKGLYFIDSLIGPGQDRLFVNPCASDGHDGYLDNRRVIDFAKLKTMNHLACKFTEINYGYCYLCVYRRDTQISKNGIKRIF